MLACVCVNATRRWRARGVDVTCILRQICARVEGDLFERSMHVACIPWQVWAELRGIGFWLLSSIVIITLVNLWVDSCRSVHLCSPSELFGGRCVTFIVSHLLPELISNHYELYVLMCRKAIISTLKFSFVAQIGIKFEFKIVFKCISRRQCSNI